MGKYHECCGYKFVCVRVSVNMDGKIATNEHMSILKAQLMTELVPF